MDDGDRSDQSEDITRMFDRSLSGGALPAGGRTPQNLGGEVQGVLASPSPLTGNAPSPDPAPPAPLAPETSDYELRSIMGSRCVPPLALVPRATTSSPSGCEFPKRHCT